MKSFQLSSNSDRVTGLVMSALDRIRTNNYMEEEDGKMVIRIKC